MAGLVVGAVVSRLSGLALVMSEAQISEFRCWAVFFGGLDGDDGECGLFFKMKAGSCGLKGKSSNGGNSKNLLL